MNRLLLLSETNYKYLKKKKKVIVILCEAQEVSRRWQVNGGGGRQGTAPLGSPERAVRRGAAAAPSKVTGKPPVGRPKRKMQDFRMVNQRWTVPVRQIQALGAGKQQKEKHRLRNKITPKWKKTKPPKLCYNSQMWW